MIIVCYIDKKNATIMMENHHLVAMLLQLHNLMIYYIQRELSMEKFNNLTLSCISMIKS